MHIPESNPGRGRWTLLISKESEKKRQAKEETRKGKEAKEAEAKSNKDAKEKQKEKDTLAEVFVAVWWLDGGNCGAWTHCPKGFSRNIGGIYIFPQTVFIWYEVSNYPGLVLSYIHLQLKGPQGGCGLLILPIWS